jgi:hypothetical protein
MAKYTNGKPQLKCNNCFSVFSEVIVLELEELSELEKRELSVWGDVLACPSCNRRFRFHGPEHHIIVYGTGRKRGEDGIEWYNRG